MNESLENNKKTFVDWIIRSAQLFTLLALFFYAIGFLIWNFYLAGFGFFESAIIQTRYIVTGAYFVFLHIPRLIVTLSEFGRETILPSLVELGVLILVYI